MEECPDSARIYLSLLDSTIQLEPEETRMYYGLLTTKAQDKKYIRHKSDSLMKKVVRFYESHGDKEKLMEAYYYLGSVYRDMRDAPRAVAAFQQAADVGENSQRYDILGRIYSQMGTLLAYQSLYEDALKIYKISYAYNLKREAGPGLVYALRDQGRMYEALNQPDSAEYYYQAAYEKAFELNNQRVINAISTELGFFYLDLGKIDSAKNVFSRIPAFKQDAIYLQTLARSYQLTSQPDSAEFYYLKTLQEGIQNQNIYLKSNSYEALAKLEANKGNYHSAFDYAQKSMKLEDSIKKTTRTEAIGKINALYNYQHTEKENQQLLLENEQQQNHNFLLIICILVLVIVATLYISRLKTQKQIDREQQKQLLQLKEEQYNNSLAYILENKKKIAELESLLQQTEGEKDTIKKQLILSQKELLEASNQKAQKAQNEKDLLELSLRKSDIYQLFHQAVHQDNRSITEESWKELQKIIDTTYNRFTEQLYALHPQISENELRICYLIKIQIPIKGIARILLLTQGAISNSRARLYKKIHRTEGNGEMLDKFILDL
jgi:tetratricopeptide (TPR) repeat protein